ncbi:glycosyltransferase [Oleomonas cavernae]|uniref:Glycosyltransferase n=2 Tax=Oleomonas cavernae TaxID=2320859 RepID=A0A418WJE3_9PROT|nr:glycosyltransferase [Oleomonas cavernae]
MIAEWQAAGRTVRHLALGDSFPLATAGDIAAADAALAGLAPGTTVLVDGLAFSAVGSPIGRHARRLDLVALIHHPLSLETGLAPDIAAALRESELAALAQARAIVATSHETARGLIADFAVDPGRLSVAVPGTDTRGRAPARGNPPLLLSIATVIPRKGHDLLVAALARLAERPWTCRIVGDHDRDPAWTEKIRAAIAAAGLGARITLAGITRDPAAELQAADIFVLPSRYEGYGMAFAEALASGLPVVACRAGAVPEVVPDSAGILVPVDDAGALAAALALLLDDPARRRRLSDGAYAAGQRLPRWADSARTIAAVLDRVGP